MAQILRQKVKDDNRSGWRSKGTMVNELKHASLFFLSLTFCNYALPFCKLYFVLLPANILFSTGILPPIFYRLDFLVLFFSWREVYNTCSRTVLMHIRPVGLNEMVKLYYWSQLQWWGTNIWQCCHCSNPCFLIATFLDLNNFQDDKSNCLTYLYQLKFAFSYFYETHHANFLGRWASCTGSFNDISQWSGWYAQDILACFWFRFLQVQGVLVDL